MKPIASTLLAILQAILALLPGVSAEAPSAPAAESASSSVTAESAASAAEALPAETPQPTAAPLVTLEALDTAVLPYDDIRLISSQMDGQTYPCINYFTMCKDGKWGLMRSDGTVVLPCLAPEPLFSCGIDESSWHGYYDANGSDTDYYALMEQINPQLQASGDGYLCGDHGGVGYLLCYYLPAESDTMQLFGGSVGPGELSVITDNDWQTLVGPADGIVPTQTGTAVQQDWYVEIQDKDTAYTYRHRDGTAAGSTGYESADFFFGQALAPAERGGKWVYLDTTGQEVTDACYDPVYDVFYGDNISFGSDVQYQRAAPLLSGYTVVSRGGKFGLLDSTGSECLPCSYDGLAWNGETLWEKQADGWHAYRIPGVTKTTLLDRMPDTITKPDTLRISSDPIYYITTSDGSLNLRTGPGTDYDSLMQVPPDSAVYYYGSLSSVPGWVLVRYGLQFGWASTDYLRTSYSS